MYTQVFGEWICPDCEWIGPNIEFCRPTPPASKITFAGPKTWDVKTAVAIYGSTMEIGTCVHIYIYIYVCMIAYFTISSWCEVLPQALLLGQKDVHGVVGHQL
jgi:hypothetical protein